MRRKKLFVAKTARSDMDVAWEYVLPGGKAAADRYVSKLRKQLRMLARFPGMGRARDELRIGLRSFPLSPFVIFFRVDEDCVVILRILHGARDFEAFWKRESE